MGEIHITQLETQDREFLKSKSAATLPDNPSGRGLSADQIRAKLYEPLIVIFEWIKNLQTEIIDGFSSSGETVNSLVTKLRQDITSGAILSKKAEQDANGNNISTTYESISNVNQKLNALESTLKELISNVDSKVDSHENNVLDGVTIVKKAEQDANGNDISATYIPYSKIASDKDSVDSSQLATLGIVKTLLNTLSNSLVNGSIETLDTLKELADALGNDPNFATTITNLIGTKISTEDANSTFLSKTDAAISYATKSENNATAKKIDDFVDKWKEVPKISNLGNGRYSFTYEEWIGNLGNGRYSFEVNL